MIERNWEKLNFRNLPNLAGLYFRVLFKSLQKTPKSQPKPQLTKTGLLIEDFTFNQNQWRKYASLFDGSEEPLVLPLPFVFVATQKAQLMLMTHKLSQLKVLGLIHRSVEFHAVKPFSINATYQVKVYESNQTETDLGFEFQITAELRDQQGDLVMKYLSDYLVKKPKPRSKASEARQKSSQDSLVEWDEVKKFNVKTVNPYAWVSKDLNPIHLKGFSKLFGMKRPIAHGMYMVGLICACQKQQLAQARFDFLRPAVLPAPLKLVSNESGLYLLNEKSKPVLRAEIVTKP